MENNGFEHAVDFEYSRTSRAFNIFTGILAFGYLALTAGGCVSKNAKLRELARMPELKYVNEWYNEELARVNASDVSYKRMTEQRDSLKLLYDFRAESIKMTYEENGLYVRK